MTERVIRTPMQLRVGETQTRRKEGEMKADRLTILKLDRYEYGAVLTSLINERNKKLREGKSTDTYDDVILKMSKAKNGQERECDCNEAR